jgi:two-component system, NtrC family, sensor histidine kinase KinB
MTYPMNIADSSLQVFLNSIDAITLITHRQKLYLANSSALLWLGSETKPGNSLWSMVAPTSRRLLLKAYVQLRSGEYETARLIVGLRLASKEAAEVEISIKTAPFLGEDFFTVSIHYINQVLQGNRSTQSLQATNSIVKNPVLNEIFFENRLVNNTLNQFLETLQMIIPYDSASIALFNKGKMEFIAARGLPNRVNLTELNISHESIIPKITGELVAVGTGEAQIVHDVLKSPSWIQIEGTEYIRSWMGIPLRFEESLIGILNLDHSEQNFFNNLYARYASAMAQQAIMAIVYTRLYQEAQQDIAERQRLQQVLIKNLINTETLYAAQQLLFETDYLSDCLNDVLQIISASLDNTQLLVIIFNTKTSELMHYLVHPEDSKDSWKIFTEALGLSHLAKNKMPPKDLLWREGEIRKLSDGQMAIGGVVNRRGLLLALRPDDAEPFSEMEHELIITIAAQMTIALENEMLYAELRQHSQQLERVVEQRAAQLAVEQRRLQAILDATAEGIFYMENFALQYANPAFCRMVGYSLEELYGKPLSFLRVMPEVSEQHNFNALLDKPLEVETGRNETRLRTRDGREFHAVIRFSLLGQPGENPVRMVAIARDISQERKLYFQRARFIANAAHELRTPLSSLMLRLHMLRKQPEKRNDHLDSLDKVTHYLRQLVEQLLDLSRFERGSIVLDRDTFVMQDLVNEAVQEHLPFAEEEGISVTVNLSPESISAKVDGTRIVQMISNLVVNGINYNRRGGSVKIDLRLEHDFVGNRNVIIELVDDGLGIEPELLPDDIFEPFSRPSQGNRKETGMGLALVKEIVHLHGGTIYASSRKDDGSRFYISLPLE